MAVIRPEAQGWGNHNHADIESCQATTRDILNLNNNLTAQVCG